MLQARTSSAGDGSLHPAAYRDSCSFVCSRRATFTTSAVISFSRLGTLRAQSPFARPHSAGKPSLHDETSSYQNLGPENHRVSGCLPHAPRSFAHSSCCSQRLGNVFRVLPLISRNMPLSRFAHLHDFLLIWAGQMISS